MNTGLNVEELIRENIRLEDENKRLVAAVKGLQIRLNEAEKLMGVNAHRPNNARQYKSASSGNFLQTILANKKRIYLGIFLLIIIIGLIKIVASL